MKPSDDYLTQKFLNDYAEARNPQLVVSVDDHEAAYYAAAWLQQIDAPPGVKVLVMGKAAAGIFGLPWPIPGIALIDTTLSGEAIERAIALVWQLLGADLDEEKLKFADDVFKSMGE